MVYSNMDQIFESASRKIMKGDSSELIKIIESCPQILNESRNGETLLHIACDNGMTQIVEVLLSSGCNPNIFNSDGETSLHLAIYREYFEIVTLLLKFKADPYLKNSQGKDSFLYAKDFDEVAIEEVLEQYRDKELITDDWYYSKSSEVSFRVSPASKPDASGSRYEIAVINCEIIHTEISTYQSSNFINSNFKSLHSQSLKTKANFSQEDIFDYLQSLKLRKYFKKFISSGFDCLNSLLIQTKTPQKLNPATLNQIGISIKKDQTSIISSLAALSKDLTLETKYETIYHLLEDLSLTQYFLNFSSQNLLDLDWLVSESKSNPITLDSTFQDHLSIQKPGHRMQILGLLQSQQPSSSSRCMLL